MNVNATRCVPPQRTKGVSLAAHRLPRLLAGTLAVLALGVTAPAEASTQAAAAPACKGASCNGKNPNTTGCDKDAVTPAGAVARSAGGGPAVQMRYSKMCNAVWARFESAANSNFRGKLEIKNGKPYVFHASPNYPAYTKMVNASLATRPCVEHYDGAGGSWACTEKWY
ncbi:predicted protein [Streptomyces viridosporus ATCC 14672]|uniref:Predicted protein n=1 Tax=Streptomyces viridosporus (strain ATCC 14672 / DSM 40746 / JCM 4963 / KCTC 9882 / NRRL B-12104 / FH 1290) TaxID=566461 RepID=D6AAI0_STRV1|nr:predicted protein [Streptomyces viridosporus ATCC 14672]